MVKRFVVVLMLAAFMSLVMATGAHVASAQVLPGDVLNADPGTLQPDINFADGADPDGVFAINADPDINPDNPFNDDPSSSDYESVNEDVGWDSGD